MSKKILCKQTLKVAKYIVLLFSFVQPPICIIMFFGSARWPFCESMKRWISLITWLASVWNSSVTVKKVNLCLETQFSRTLIRRIVVASSLMSLVVLLNYGIPNAEWSTLSTKIEQVPEELRIASPFFIWYSRSCFEFISLCNSLGKLGLKSEIDLYRIWCSKTDQMLHIDKTIPFFLF